MDIGMAIVEGTADDSIAVFDWRNDAVTRSASISQDPVRWEHHANWFAGVLADPDRYLYLAVVDGERIGLCRFDRTGSSAEVSINLNPEFRGRGLSEPILRACIARFREDAGRGIALTATIRPENVASVRIFASVGFTPSRSDEMLAHFVLDPEPDVA